MHRVRNGFSSNGRAVPLDTDAGKSFSATLPSEFHSTGASGRNAPENPTSCGTGLAQIADVLLIAPLGVRL
jgi:hypothetical protein